MTDGVLLSIAGPVATVTLNRPQRGNALTGKMGERLTQILAQLEEDTTVRVLVLTGTGKYFCTGMDLSGEDSAHAFEQSAQIFEALDRFPKPVIARINGPALGGGVGLIFTTDIRIATQTVYFALPEVKRGLAPAIISQYLVPELGRQRAREYMLTGRRISAAEATFLSATVQDESALDADVQKYIGMLLDSAPGAMATIKKLVATIQHPNPDAAAYIKPLFQNMLRSDEAAIGIAAFLSNTRPNWDHYRQSKF